MCALSASTISPPGPASRTPTCTWWNSARRCAWAAGQSGPGGLLLDDQHGIHRAPREIAAGISEAARLVAEGEQRFMSVYSSADFSLKKRLEA